VCDDVCVCVCVCCRVTLLANGEKRNSTKFKNFERKNDINMEHQCLVVDWWWIGFGFGCVCVCVACFCLFYPSLHGMYNIDYNY
jgi:hypothetical protein